MIPLDKFAHKDTKIAIQNYFNIREKKKMKICIRAD